jgi:hypothetical protein
MDAIAFRHEWQLKNRKDRFCATSADCWLFGLRRTLHEALTTALSTAVNASDIDC